MTTPELSIVVPVLNEEAAIPLFVAKVAPILAGCVSSYEIVFVDDGSTDGTIAAINACRLNTPEVRAVELSRNFGKEAALTAGLAHARGHAVVPMDVDLQDPPDLIPEMVAKWRTGEKVVLALRRDRSTDSWLKRASASYFYEVMSAITDVTIPANCGDYRLMDREVVLAILSFPERSRFMKGIMAAAGYRTCTIEYDRPERIAGESKFNFWRLWNFALDGITGFSTVPLRMWTYIGLMVALFAFAYASWIVAKTLIWGVVTPGFTTLMAAVLFLGGVQLIGIGVLGEYIGRIFAETKQRPLYLVGALHGFDEATSIKRIHPLRRSGQ